MTTLTIIANITANPNKIELVKAKLLKLVELTRTEEGCLQFDLHQDNENPAHFTLYENWTSRILWQTHMMKQHAADYMAATQSAVTKFRINEMTKIA